MLVSNFFIILLFLWLYQFSNVKDEVYSKDGLEMSYVPERKVPSPQYRQKYNTKDEIIETKTQGDNRVRNAVIITIIIAIILIIIVVIIMLVFSANFNKQNKGTSVGAPCNNTGDCQPGLLCSEGICKAQPGDSCINSSDCIAPSSCQNGICVNPVGQTCNTNSQCQSGFVCSGNICKGGQGTSCTNPSSCASNICENGQCGTKAGLPCPSNGCGNGLSCQGGLCVYDLGSNCSAAPTRCEGALVCDIDRTPSICAIPLNQPCSGGGCITGATCDPLSNTCKVSQGGSCIVDGDCTTPFECVNNRCHELACLTTNNCLSQIGAGFVCQGDNRCYSNGTCLGMDASTCSESPNAVCPTNSGGYCKNTNGAICSSNIECLSGFCNQNLSPSRCQ